MKAIVQDRYGPPDEVLQLRDIARPVAGEHDVLVQVECAGLHIGDCFIIRGVPFPVRLAMGLIKPKSIVRGLDVSGQVAAVGNSVNHFQVGDEVFGVTTGAWAEYAVVEETRLVLKPANLTFEEAAAVPTSALAALHGLRDAGQIRPGQSVLINGASGGVGSYAVQLAKEFGADVTGVCSTKNVAMVRSLGADHVIDYTQRDFTQGEERYDLILDNVENHSLAQCRRVLSPSGTLVLNSGSGARGVRLLVRLAMPLVLSPFIRQHLRRYFSTANHDDLILLKDLIESGKLRPVVDKKYPLRDTPAAIRYIETGHARGKTVITIGMDPSALTTKA